MATMNTILRDLASTNNHNLLRMLKQKLLLPSLVSPYKKSEIHLILLFYLEVVLMQCKNDS